MNPSGQKLRRFSAMAIMMVWVWTAAAQFAPLTNDFPRQPLSLTGTVDIALRQNPLVLRARQDIEAAEGVVIQTRAVALPKVAATGGYRALEPSAVDTPPFPLGPGITFNTDQSWQTQFRVFQSLYEGGRIASSFRVTRLVRQQSMLNYQATLANVILEVQTAYYSVLLAEQQIAVQEASVRLLEQELNDTKRRFEAGSVPRFNVLRAEVELANARPRLIRARNDYRIAKSNLSVLLGLDSPRQEDGEIPLWLSGKLEALPWNVELIQALTMAQERRPELGALRKAEALRREDIINAKAGRKPSLQAFAGYDAHSSMFSSDLSQEVHGWITGVQLSWDIFDGGRTRGRIRETEALYRKAGIELDDTSRRVELEVRTAHSTLIEAREVLQSQEKVLESAEESLRLARARYGSGTGTQLDVLGAQTALTEARTTQIQALRDYAVARARVERAVGLNVPSQNPLSN